MQIDCLHSLALLVGSGNSCHCRKFRDDGSMNRIVQNPQSLIKVDCMFSRQPKEDAFLWFMRLNLTLLAHVVTDLQHRAVSLQRNVVPGFQPDCDFCSLRSSEFQSTISPAMDGILHTLLFRADLTDCDKKMLLDEGKHSGSSPPSVMTWIERCNQFGSSRSDCCGYQYLLSEGTQAVHKCGYYLCQPCNE